MEIGIVALISISAGICVMLVLGTIGYFVDKHTYNNGICRKCGGKVRCFDVDSQGGMGYACDNCNEHFWISWYNPKNDD
jgi:hypothetical protein